MIPRRQPDKSRTVPVAGMQPDKSRTVPVAGIQPDKSRTVPVAGLGGADPVGGRGCVGGGAVAVALGGAVRLLEVGETARWIPGRRWQEATSVLGRWLADTSRRIRRARFALNADVRRARHRAIDVVRHREIRRRACGEHTSDRRKRCHRRRCDQCSAEKRTTRHRTQTRATSGSK